MSETLSIKRTALVDRTPRAARPVLLALVALTVCTQVLAQSWWDVTWTRRRMITIDNSTRGEALQNFPMLVSVTSGEIDYSQTQDAGEDVRFVDADDATLLSHEIERWNESGTSSIWVKVPQIDASSATGFIWMYYGNGGASDGQDGPGVWSNGYVGVWHLDSDFNDSTQYGNDGTNAGSTNVAGQIADGQQFDRVDDYVSIASSASLRPTDQLSVSAWVRGTAWDTGSYVNPVLRNGEANPNSYQFGVDGSAIALFLDEGDGGGVHGNTTLNAGQWYYIAASWDGSNIMIYLDGSADLGAPAARPGTIPADTDVLYLGGRPGTDLFNGIIDEVRFASVPRTAAWMDAQNDSVRDGLVSYAAEVVLPSPGAFDLLSPSSGIAGTLPVPTLDWGDAAYVASYRLQIDDDPLFGTPEVQETFLIPSAYTVNDGSLMPDTLYYWQVTAVNAAGSVPANSAFTFRTRPGLPPPWVSEDVGGVSIAGDATYSGGEFTIDAAGWDIWGTADGMHYVYQSVSSDCQITARILSHDFVEAYAKAAVMIRASTDAGSLHAMSVMQHLNGASLMWRDTVDDLTDNARLAVNTNDAPCWVRLRRAGDTFTAFTSIDGAAWDVLQSTAVVMGDPVLIGMAVTSHDDAASVTVVFDNVEVIVGAPASFLLLSPADASTDATLPVTLDWQDASGAETYALLVDDDSDFSSPLIDEPLVAASAYAVPEGLLSEDVVYYWRVTATNALGSVAAANNDFSFTPVAAIPLDYLGGGCGSAGANRHAAFLTLLLALAVALKRSRTEA